MTRRRPLFRSSFDLLLDAMCNTFGCIVLLAILVAVLLQNASATQSPSEERSIDRAQWLAMQAQLKAAQTKLQHLQELAQALEKIIPKPGDAEMIDNVEQLQALNARRRDLLEQKQAFEEKMVAQRRRLEQLAQQKKKIDSEINHSDYQLARLEAALKQEMKRRSEDSRLPYERDTRKKGLALVIRYGRLYIWHEYDRAGNRLGLNTKEFVVVKEASDGIYTLPKPYAGVPISMGSESAIRSLLRDFDPQDWFLDMPVWADSFEVFQTFKAVAVSLGYEYCIIPMAEGEDVLDRGGKGRVQ